MPLRAVLFDMDGVLLKSEEAWFRVARAACATFGSGDVTHQEFARGFGQGTAADVASFNLRCSVAELDAFYARELVKHLDTVWVNPDARPLLDALSRRGLKLAVVTNTVGVLAKEMLAGAKLADAFHAFATADRATSKPAPDLLHLALSELDVAPHEAVMVGDSRFDRQAAAAAKVRFIGFGLDGDVRVERLSEVDALTR